MRDRGTEAPSDTTPTSTLFAFQEEKLSWHLLLSFLSHALPTETVMGPRPGGVGACPTFLLLENLSSLHELGVLAALTDVGSRLCNWVEHREGTELVAVEERERLGAMRARLRAE